MNKPAPRLYEHVCKVFQAMREEAKPEQIQGKHVLVYEGHTTKLFQRLSLPTPYYTSILGRLQAMGCIRQLSRGGGSAESRWALIDDPSLPSFMRTSPRQRQTRLAAVEGRIDELADRIAELENASGFSAAEMERETRIAAEERNSA